MCLNMCFLHVFTLQFWKLEGQQPSFLCQKKDRIFRPIPVASSRLTEPWLLALCACESIRGRFGSIWNRFSTKSIDEFIKKDWFSNTNWLLISIFKIHLYLNSQPTDRPKKAWASGAAQAGSSRPRDSNLTSGTWRSWLGARGFGVEPKQNGVSWKKVTNFFLVVRVIPKNEEMNRKKKWRVIWKMWARLSQF